MLLCCVVVRAKVNTKGSMRPTEKACASTKRQDQTVTITVVQTTAERHRK